jgi:hypothetical protein
VTAISKFLPGLIFCDLSDEASRESVFDLFFFGHELARAALKNFLAVNADARGGSDAEANAVAAHTHHRDGHAAPRNHNRFTDLATENQHTNLFPAPWPGALGLSGE